MNGDNPSNNDDECEDRLRERRRKQQPGPPYRANTGTLIATDRRIRPDPRLDKLIEVEWEEEDSPDPGIQDQT